MFIFDAHCDAPTQILRLRDFSIDNPPYAQIDFPKLKKGGLGASFFALYIPHELKTDDAFRYAATMLEKTLDAIGSAPDVELATGVEDALDNSRRGIFSVFLSLENASPIGHDISKFKWFYDKGIRCVTLCHNLDNEVCGSAAGKGGGTGLSDFGKELVAAMNETGVLVDCAHASDKTFYDLLEVSRVPFVSTHSSCRALCPHRRNMTDEMISLMAEKGGVININFYPAFIDEEFSKTLSMPEIEALWPIEERFAQNPSDENGRREWDKALAKLHALERPSYRKIVDHIDHAVGLVGADHVGLGSDFDGICVTPEGLDDVSQTGKILDEMRMRGYSEGDIEKIAGRNMFRVLSQSLDPSLRRIPSMK